MIYYIINRNLNYYPQKDENLRHLPNIAMWTGHQFYIILIYLVNYEIKIREGKGKWEGRVMGHDPCEVTRPRRYMTYL